MASALCRQSSPLLAVGTLSPPQYAARRLTQRQTWMRFQNVGHDDPATICALFVVRSGNAPLPLTSSLEQERGVYSDMLLAHTVAWDESRVRGPVLSLVWWLRYASKALAHAHFVAKLDDDAYIHAPDLERLLWLTHAEMGGNAAVYLGIFTWYSWYAQIFERTGHGWTADQAASARRGCHTHNLTQPAHVGMCGPAGCGPCSGPFPFASGFLIVLSRVAVAALSRGRALEAEEAALRSLGVASLPGALPRAVRRSAC